MLFSNLHSFQTFFQVSEAESFFPRECDHMQKFPNPKVFKVVLDWIQKEYTVESQHSDNCDLLANLPPCLGEGSIIKKTAMARRALMGLGEFLLVKYQIIHNSEWLKNEWYLGYFLYVLDSRVKLKGVEMLANDINDPDHARIHSESILYWPYIDKKDTHLMLLDMSRGNFIDSSNLAMDWIQMEARLGPLIPRPVKPLPMTIFCLRLLAACSLIDLTGTPYLGPANPIYDAVLNALTKCGKDWDDAFANLITHCQRESFWNNRRNKYDTPDYATPYYVTIYPVSPLAALAVRKKLLPDSADKLDFDYRPLPEKNPNVLDENELYDRICDRIRSWAPDFKFPET